MSTERDVNRIVRSWMDEGVTALPDHVLDAVLDQVPATPQRRSWWLARRDFHMNKFVAMGLGVAAAVVAFLIVGQLIGLNSSLPGLRSRGLRGEPLPRRGAGGDRSTRSGHILGAGPCWHRRRVRLHGRVRPGEAGLKRDRRRCASGSRSCPTRLRCLTDACDWFIVDRFRRRDLPLGSGWSPCVPADAAVSRRSRRGSCAAWYRGRRQRPISVSLDGYSGQVVRAHHGLIRLCDKRRRVDRTWRPGSIRALETHRWIWDPRRRGQRLVIDDGRLADATVGRAQIQAIHRNSMLIG